MTIPKKFVPLFRSLFAGLAAGLLFSVANAQSGANNQAVTTDLGLKPIPGFLPAWSPDGKKIAFLRGSANIVHVYTMNIDGTNQTKITRHDSDNFSFSWSPDSSKIVFSTDRDQPFSMDINNPARYEMYMINANGSGVKRLTLADYHSLWPSWSPDGQTIAYTSGPAGSAAIYQMNADGSGQRKLSTGTGIYKSPAWSPDGKRIVMFGAGFQDNDIYLMDADGGGITKLATAPGRAGFPSWSPDGSKIAFNADKSIEANDCSRYSAAQIYMVAVRGGELSQLTNDCDNNSGPSWSPDGSKIVFGANSKPYRSLYVIDADGGNKIQLTDAPVF